LTSESNPQATAAGRLEELVHHPSTEVLGKVAADPALNEDLALAILARRDLPHVAIEALAKNGGVMKSRRVMLAVVAHPHTPRHVSLPLIRHLYTFELMQLALLPAIAADLKLAAERAILVRLDTISAGERLTLAKRGSAGLAAALLLDSESRVIEAALVNPRMTEAAVVKALMRQNSPEKLAALVCRDSRWCNRREVQLALIGSGKAPLAPLVSLMRTMTVAALRQGLQSMRLSPAVKQHLLRELEGRAKSAVGIASEG
jgi:hypothetical protein